VLGGIGRELKRGCFEVAGSCGLSVEGGQVLFVGHSGPLGYCYNLEVSSIAKLARVYVGNQQEEERKKIVFERSRGVILVKGVGVI
jgi:hypothetical protein